MPGTFRRISRRLGVTSKMVVMTLLLGIAVWGVLDYTFSRTVRALFREQLNERLKREALEDRIRFDHNLNAHHQLAKLIVNQGIFRDYLESRDWFRSKAGDLRLHSTMPQWFPSPSLLRTLATPRFAILLDSRGVAREAYQGPGGIPLDILHPSRMMVSKSHGQFYISAIEGLPYLTTAATLAGPGGARVTLLISSPLDESFLMATLGDTPERLVGILSLGGEHLVVSNRPDLLPHDTSLEKLKEKYITTAKTTQDYGAAEFPIIFTSFVPTAEIERLTRAAVREDRRERVILALALIFCFFLLMTYFSGRISRLSTMVEKFSRDTLGGRGGPRGRGDQLYLLEESFRVLTEEVGRFQKRIRESAARSARRKAELGHKDRLFQLLQSVTESLGIGVLLHTDSALTAANRKMEYYTENFGGTAAFDIPEGADAERVLPDLNGEDHIFDLKTLALASGERVVLVQEVTAGRKAEADLRTSEERFRSLFENSKDAIYLTARDGTVLEANQATLDLFGYTEGELIGENIIKLYSYPGERVKFIEAIEEAGSVRDYDIALRHQSGTELLCQVTATVRRGGAGEILGFQGIIRDITEKKKIEKELMRIEKLESVGILAGGVAHDFNNILQTVLTNINIAMMLSRENAAAEGHLVEAERATMRAKELTSQLLTFARGGSPIRRVMPIAELIHESVKFALRGSDIMASVEIADRLWQVEVDEGQFIQVINNLVMNAQQAMPGGGEVTVEAVNVHLGGRDGIPLKDGNYVKISIRDQGRGIPEEDIPHIFDPFFSTKDHGSGLGLAVVYSIVKDHAGHITVSSGSDGTVFFIYLPAADRGPLPAQEFTPHVAKGDRILVMDDEDHVRKSISATLTHLGYDVVVASEGGEALELFQSARESGRPFDAVILDLTVRGGMSGKVAIAKLLELQPDVKAIVSSGYFNDPVMADYQAFGFRGILAKPYTASDLERVLGELLAKN